MQYQLILRFRKTSIEYPDEIKSLEQALTELLGDSAQLDGYDTGAREVVSIEEFAQGRARAPAGDGG